MLSNIGPTPLGVICGFAKGVLMIIYRPILHDDLSLVTEFPISRV